MKKRSPIAVFLLPFVTFGIYYIYWLVKTKGEMNQQGAAIPTAWLIIIPFVNIWWMWKYSEGVEKVTGGKISTILAFLLILLLETIGAAIIQDGFNKIAKGPTPANTATPTADTPQPTATTAPTEQTPTDPAAPQT